MELRSNIIDLLQEVDVPDDFVEDEMFAFIERKGLLAEFEDELEQNLSEMLTEKDDGEDE